MPHWAFAEEKALPGATQTTESGSEPVIQMAPYRIQDFGFEMSFSASKKTGKIRELKITSVTPGSSAAKAGLRAGDLLLSVDGTAVTSVKYTDLAVLFNRSVPAGQPIRYSFTVARGLMRKRSTITFEIKSKEQKMPNQAPEPAAPSGPGSP
jgi:C-terminal processing protease CtpA/Prc